jgi:hypothetical protein
MRYVDAEMNASDSIKLLEILSINHRKDIVESTLVEKIFFVITYRQKLKTS